MISKNNARFKRILSPLIIIFYFCIKLQLMRKGLSLFLVISLIFLGSCRKGKPVFNRFGGFIQGTTYSMIIQNKGNINPEQLKSDVEKILHSFDMSLSLYVDSSILSKVNRNENVQLDTFFIRTFKKSFEIYKETDGAFDITVGPLVRAWGFGPDAHRNFSDSKRDSLLKLVGMYKVSIKNGKLIKTDPAIELDFNAIAQGYSVDVISEYFNSLGIKNYLIEIGGEVRAKGDKGGKYWRIGIDKPEDSNDVPGSDLEAIVELKDLSLSTSGNYRKFYIENGIKYSHTIDPKTGYPARNTLLSASVVAADCATADGFATACMVMGKDKTIQFLARHPELEAFLVYSDDSGKFKTWTSQKLAKRISETKDK
jgi:FAD:protein FMN transferase